MRDHCHTFAMNKFGKFIDVLGENVPAENLPTDMQIDMYGDSAQLVMRWDEESTIKVIVDKENRITAELQMHAAFQIVDSGMVDKSIFQGMMQIADLVYYELVGDGQDIKF